jgi:hypothetical protein
MVVLKLLEKLAVQAAIAVLKDVESKVTNPAAVTGLQDAIAFLEDLVGEKVSAT